MNLESIQKITSLHFEEAPRRDFPLSKLTTFRMGGPCNLLVSLSNAKEAGQAIQVVEAEKIPWMVLGKGSNSIFSDRGFVGVIFLLKNQLQSIRRKERGVLRLGCGLANSSLAAFCRKEGCGSLEFLATIPGTVGGGLFMNAGAYGKEMKDCLISAEFIRPDGTFETLSNDAFRFQYRHSVLFDRKGILLFADLKVRESDPDTVKEKQAEMIEQRKKTQPVKTKNWGSVFRNPEGNSAGKLIEACGLKGKGFGDARISEKHANFIENHGNAKFEDAVHTIRMARESVREKFGITLIPEVRVFSETGEVVEI